METDPKFEHLLDEVKSMFTLLDGFRDTLKKLDLDRYERLHQRYDRVRTEQLREWFALDQKKAKASTAQEARRCVLRGRALAKKHTKQINDLWSQLANFARAKLRD